MKLMVVGDTHGGRGCLIPKLNIANHLKIQHVLVVGDFGLWDHWQDGHVFLDAVQASAEENGLSVYAIGGNHENWDHWNWYVENMPTSKGFGMVRSRILLAPKVHRWQWAKKTFYGAGGAVSIDKDDRLKREKGGDHFNPSWGMKMHYGNGTGPRTQWWDNEQFTDEDVEKMLKLHRQYGDADYLFSHDCSDHTPFYERLKPDLDSQIHRQRMDKVIAMLKPKQHFHGHMHNKFDWVNTKSHGLVETAFGTAEDNWNGAATKTYGLECNQDFFSWGVLDLNSDKFYWPDDEKIKSQLEDFSMRNLRFA